MPNTEDSTEEKSPRIEVAGRGGLLKEQRVHVAKEHAAWILALSLFLLLAVIIVGHYAVATYMCVRGLGDCPQSLNDIANGSLAVVAGLFGSVTTYYYTVERKS